MRVGDLVGPVDEMIEFPDTGIVVSVDDSVEVPPIVEVLWDNGYISRTYSDELTILSNVGVHYEG
jgi:hypothetical protein